MYQGNTLSLQPLGNGLAELSFDAQGRPVNVFNRETVAELKSALDVLEASRDIVGLLITSAKGVFVVGADITEFAGAFAGCKEDVRRFLWPNNTNFNRIESLPFPVVVAINGFALGGGFELCLACDFRIMSSAARIGFPEVGLGLVPGWGGTVRAPRLADFEVGVEWVAHGAQHKADAALAAGLVDSVCAPEDLREQALVCLHKAVAGELDKEAVRARKTGPVAITQSELAEAGPRLRAVVDKKYGPHYPAGAAAVELLIAAAFMARDEALEVEFDTFHSLAKSPAGRALVGNFTNDAYLSQVAKKFAAKASVKIAACGVLGAGIMGGGIAYQNALKGIPSVMKDINQGALDLGIGEARGLLSRQVSRGAMSQDKADDILTRIQPTLDYDAMAKVDLLVEAVVEKEAVKKAVLAEVEKLVAPTTVLASNTSSILISSIATALERPENFCGIHFFNPVHAMQLVEVVRGEKTSEDTVARAVAYVLAIGKKPVVVKDCPGFLVNRTLFPYFAGFHMLVREGADLERVDRVMEQWGWPMGPAYLTDVVGIDVCVHAGDVVAAGFPDRLTLDYRSATHVLFAANRFGQKNGLGFYKYEKNDKGRLAKVADPEVKALLADHVAAPVVFSDEEIVARMMIPMATEMARCLEEGIAGSPQEADQGLLFGLGFPAFRGGICRWMDELGMAEVCALADKYAHLGKLYEPTETMRAMAKAGKSYY